MSTLLRRAGAALVVTLALAGCSSSAPEQQLDDATLTSRLRAAGVEPTPDVATWRAAALTAFCDGSDDAFRLTLADAGQTPETLRKTRVVVEALCPERVAAVDQAIAAR